MTRSIEIKIRKARSFEKKGSLTEALACYREILHRYPKNQRALKALSRVVHSVKEPSASDQQKMVELYGRGHLQELLIFSQTLSRNFPTSEQVWTFLGAAAIGLNKLEQASGAFSRAVSLKPKKAAAHANLGAVYERQHQFKDAASCFSRAILLAPNHADYRLFRANACLETGETDLAISDLETCLKADPKNIQALRKMAQAMCQSNSFDAAIDLLERALILSPRDNDIGVEIAEACLDGHKYDQARTHLDTVLGAEPDNAKALMSMGTLCLTTGEIQNAITHFERAIAHDDSNAMLWNNLSSAQFAAGLLEAAAHSAQRAIAINPRHAKAHHNLANAHQQQGALDLAIDSYETALGLAPEMGAARAQLLHFKAQICDWSAFDSFDQQPSLGIDGDIVAPWPLLGFEDAPERQLQRSRHFASQWKLNHSIPTKTRLSGKLKIGYFSSDLYDHATLSLLNGVLEAHDKAKFDIIVYGLNTPQNSAQFERMKRAVGQYHDLHNATDDAIIAQARADDLDIAVDLKGYTQNARPGPFFAGLAPVQINYLGYPGSLGSQAYDYIIADDIVIPDAQRKHYDEAVIYLPASYQPNDDARQILKPPTREECGLPKDAVVLCCFNQSYKISPREFDIWMRVLDQVDEAVLWLLDTNQWAKTNLQQTAQNRGICPQRLIFANRVQPQVHIARHQLADLFLDTFNVNAHTTASDALYAGLPVVTRPGEQFAARVGASLCRAVGMSDLITADDAAYENLVLELTQSAEKRHDIRERLARNLPSAPLFDTKSYTRQLEQGFRAAFQNFHAGQAPSDIRINA